MSHWNTSAPGHNTNRVCNIKTDKILLKNPYRQKSSTFRVGRIETIDAAKSPGKIMCYLKWNWAASQLFPFCVLAYLFHTLRTVSIILQFRHFKIFSHAVVRREKFGTVCKWWRSRKRHGCLCINFKTSPGCMHLAKEISRAVLMITVIVCMTWALN